MSQALMNHVWQRLHPIAVWSSNIQERALSMKMEKSNTSPVMQGLEESVQVTWRTYWHPMAITSSRNRTAMLCSRKRNMGPSYKTAGYQGY